MGGGCSLEIRSRGFFGTRSCPCLRLQVEDGKEVAPPCPRAVGIAGAFLQHPAAGGGGYFGAAGFVEGQRRGVVGGFVCGIGQESGLPVADQIGKSPGARADGDGSGEHGLHRGVAEGFHEGVVVQEHMEAAEKRGDLGGVVDVLAEFQVEVVRPPAGGVAGVSDLGGGVRPPTGYAHAQAFRGGREDVAIHAPAFLVPLLGIVAGGAAHEEFVLGFVARGEGIQRTIGFNVWGVGMPNFYCSFFQPAFF